MAKWLVLSSLSQRKRGSPANRLGLWDSAGRRSNGLALTRHPGAHLATDPPVPFGSDDVITVPGQMEEVPAGYDRYIDSPGLLAKSSGAVADKRKKPNNG
uniref:Uncharacterized protein n=1 Tax=Globodera rostochiensis TaxID=31243 RepID=A0A914I4T7_GLORO